MSSSISNPCVNLTECSSNYDTLLATYNELLKETTKEDECSREDNIIYSQSLHIGAIFIILACSILGTIIPILATHIKALRIPKYSIIIGKCIGIGVVLTCSLIHMLLPASEALTSDCISEYFRELYEGWAFLFALLAAVAMQFLDFSFLSLIKSRHQKKQRLQISDNHGHGNNSDEESHSPTPGSDGVCHGGHVHGGLLMDAASLKTVEAYLLEFGITVHSVFIGIAIGIVDDSTLKALLIALAFHQFFEGIALGSRIADAKLTSHWHEALLTSIFSISAPIGIAIGVGVASSINVNGETFLLIQGTFDSVCAGILLYIGFSLLFKDFPEDMDLYCKGKKFEFTMKMGMFFALYVGVAMMSLIGKYL